MVRTEQAILEAINDMSQCKSTKFEVSRDTLLADIPAQKDELFFALECGTGIVVSDYERARMQTVGDLIDYLL